MTKLSVLIQYCVPQRLFSVLMGKLAAIRSPKWLKNWAIKKFISRYGVNLTEAMESDYRHYASFNDFFSRKLLPTARFCDADEKNLISPADGCISEIGDIKKDCIIQAKKHQYSVGSLLGGTALGKMADPKSFENGKFMTVYLSPKDYHRVHMPFSGKLLKSLHIPGKFFSVNPETVKSVPNLFAKNERVVNIFETRVGKVAVIFVGAMIVGSIVMLAKEGDEVEKGQELGYFQLGSTVILLFQENQIDFCSHFAKNTVLKMGEKIGRVS